ncbi:hypothetical protein Patl1_06083 [Pistacia atlantica]|uniref:Uncharacterized protein n=1 Tax=Pistacia atlantica TaxID=434234 RepID=A0ACC1BTL3_9ROSI|nr:hypothetical protein Patl1_06083 [Pistacia atlantica]
MLLTDLELDTVKDDLLWKSSLEIKMATNICQNLGELLDELCVLIHHPKGTDDMRTDIHDYLEEYIDTVNAVIYNKKGKRNGRAFGICKC